MKKCVILFIVLLATLLFAVLLEQSEAPEEKALVALNE